MHRIIIIVMVAAFVSGSAYGQPTPDTGFKPRIEKPAYPKGSGPVVMIDEAHFNWHTVTGRYLPFAELLRRDGYIVQASRSPFGKDALNRGTILVIANAVNERNKTNWFPPFPSAFADEEIKAVHEWVKEGGSLLLIARSALRANSERWLSSTQPRRSENVSVRKASRTLLASDWH